MREVGALIAEALHDITDEETLAAVRRRVGVLTDRFPLYGWKRCAAVT
jgi:glycine/serine hydroxymethyltransferase